MVVVGIGLFCTLIGTILTTSAFVDHVTYPIWVKIPWDTVNALFVPVAGVNIFLYTLVKKRKGIAGFITELFWIAMPGIYLYFGNRDGYLSIVLFIVFVVLFFMNWSSLYPASLPRKEGEVHLDGSDDLPSLPIVSIGATTCCSICMTQNLYDICLECELKHKSEIHKVRSHNMRAKKAGEPATLTIAEWLTTLAEHRYQCAYCHDGKYEALEHYIPLGSHDRRGGTTALNCVPACRKCNLEKSNKHPER